MTQTFTTKLWWHFIMFARLIGILTLRRDRKVSACWTSPVDFAHLRVEMPCEHQQFSLQTLSSQNSVRTMTFAWAACFVYRKIALHCCSDLASLFLTAILMSSLGTKSAFSTNRVQFAHFHRGVSVCYTNALSLHCAAYSQIFMVTVRIELQLLRS